MPTMTLTLDDLDYATVQREIALRQQRAHANNERTIEYLPDGESCLAGSVIAEAIRDLEEYRALWESDDPPAGEKT